MPISNQAMIDSQLCARGISNSRVLNAMLRVPRHEFVSENLRAEAYEDHPLPIGDGQTISQPYVVALMLETLQLASTDIVLEIGTGSGYVTALLSELAAHVFSIERHAALANKARTVLSHLNCTNTQIFTADGTHGLAAHAPYDAILVSAAALTIPPPLLAQLREGGRMIIPIGPPDSQYLQFIRMINSHPEVTRVAPVRFVPLIEG